MGYLKFLGWTILAVLAIGLGMKLGSPATAFVLIVVSITISWRYGPRVIGVGYACWIALVVAWEIVIKLLERAAPQEIAKHTPDQVHLAEGFWLLVGMLVLHPICYGIGKLVARRWCAPSSTAV